MSGYVAVLVIHLHFPNAASLKGKRKDLQSVKALLRQRLGASVAEVEHQDTWQRSTLLASVVAGSPGRLDEAADRIEAWLDARFPEGVRVERIAVSVSDLQP